jgi:ABC-2 type transport system ATP-binding protein
MTELDFIKITDLTRKFKDKTALNQITLSIQEGELFGLVGPDGAGKTTLLRILAGLLHITDGHVVAAGYDLNQEPEEIKPHIGYMAQEFSLYEKLSVMENLMFFADLYDVDVKNQKDRIHKLLSFAGLTEFKNRRAAHLSGGMQKKLALASTLLHEPPLLLLDEPTTGVDPISRREFWNILTDLHLNGTTIIVSTPYMDEADRCSRVGLMYQGELVICDTPRNIRRLLDGDLVKITTSDWQAAHAVLAPLAGVKEIQTYGEALHILVDSGKKRLPQLIRALKKHNLTVSEGRTASPRMEEAFISLINEMDSRE